MNFRMNVMNIFFVSDKAILAGDLTKNMGSEAQGLAVVKMDGKEVARIFVEGEVFDNTKEISVWTKATPELRQFDIHGHAVVLESIH